MKTFPAHATVAVGQHVDGDFAVIFTIRGFLSEDHANSARLHLEAAFAETVRAIGGKLEGFEPVPFLPRNVVRG
jgi:hypothetical protein